MVIALWTVLGLAALLLLAGLVIVLAAFGRRGGDPLSPEVLESSCWSRYRDRVEAGAAWLAQQPGEDVTVRSFDGLTLHARLLPAPERRGVLLLFHGYHSAARVDFSCAAPFYHGLGFDLLLVDQRAHGESQGRFLTMGVREREDCRTWAEYCHLRYGDGVPLFLGGMSMGATTVLMAADLPLPPTVRGILADCGFTSPAEILRDLMHRKYHLPVYPLLWVVGFWSRVLAGFGLNQCSTVTSVARTGIPIQLVHGGSDRFVPCWMSRRTADAAAGECHLLVVPGAGHGASFLVDPDGYRAAAETFLERHLL